MTMALWGLFLAIGVISMIVPIAGPIIAGVALGRTFSGMRFSFWKSILYCFFGFGLGVFIVNIVAFGLLMGLAITILSIFCLWFSYLWLELKEGSTE